MSHDVDSSLETSSSPPTRFVKSPQSGRFLTWSDFCNEIIICARFPDPNNPSYAPVSLRQPSLNPTVFSLVSVWKPAVSRWAEIRYKSRTSCWKLSVQAAWTFSPGGLNTSDMTQKRKTMRVSTSLGKNLRLNILILRKHPDLLQASVEETFRFPAWV